MRRRSRAAHIDRLLRRPAVAAGDLSHLPRRVLIELHRLLIVALALAAGVALLALRARALSRSGAAAAMVVGTLAAAAGWRWAALLIVFFLSSSALSRWRADAKARRTAGIVEKGGRRDAWQVLANGGVFAVAALGQLALPHATGWWLAGAGALAAAAGDTWATEIGTLEGGTPRSLLTWRPLPVGASGGVTLVGTLGGVAGALLIALLAAVGTAASRPVALAVLAGGVAGTLADSLLGATGQARRWCPRCQVLTEQSVHVCGTPTRHAGGLRWMTNDVVNLLATVVGAAVAVALGGVRG